MDSHLTFAEGTRAQDDLLFGGFEETHQQLG